MPRAKEAMMTKVVIPAPQSPEGPEKSVGRGKHGARLGDRRRLRICSQDCPGSESGLSMY